MLTSVIEITGCNWKVWWFCILKGQVENEKCCRGWDKMGQMGGPKRE